MPAAPVGIIGVDDATSKDGIVLMNSSEATRATLYKGMFLEIRDRLTKERYFAQIANEPRNHSRLKNEDITEATEREDTVVSTLRVIGTIERDRLMTAFRRPASRSSVYECSATTVRALLRISGEHVLGIIQSSDADPVTVTVSDRMLRKQVGIYGKTGAGKSNTHLREVECITAAGWCVIDFDYLGEFVHARKPSSERSLFTDLWTGLGIEPTGVGTKSFKHWVPCSDTRDVAGAIPFYASSRELGMGNLMRIICRTEAQQRYFLEFVNRLETDNEGVDIDLHEILYELERKYGTMADGEGNKSTVYIMLQRVRNMLKGRNPLWDRYEPRRRHASLDEYGAKNGPEGRKPIPLKLDTMLRAGQYNVIDLKNSPWNTYTVVALQLLHTIMKAKKAHSNDPAKYPKVMVFMEEAHVLFNDKMNPLAQAMMDTVRDVFKIGRHYYLNCCVVSQQPRDIPDEVRAQINTHVIHRLSDARDIRAVAVGEAEHFRDLIPRLSVGEAVVDSTDLATPLVVRVAPATSRKEDPYAN